MDRVRDFSADKIVYVGANDPTPGANAVLAYRQGADGILDLLGSFPTSGTGFANPEDEIGPDDSAQNVIVNAERSLLFAVNSGSDTIAVFRIASDGSLTPVDGSPFPSGGVQPASLGLAGDRLYVVNKDHDPGRSSNGQAPNYTGFAVGSGGQLSPIPESTVSVPKGASPTQALVSPDGNFLFGADLFGGMLQSFRIRPDGGLEQHPPTPIDSPIGLGAHPLEPILYVGRPSINRLDVFRYDATGTLSPVTSVPNSGRALCWIVLNREGTRLYTVNNASNTISVYDTTDPLQPTEIQNIALPTAGGSFQEALDPAGEFLHVVSANFFGDDPSDNALHSLSVAPDGTLTLVSPSTVLPVPVIAHPAGVAVI